MAVIAIVEDRLEERRLYAEKLRESNHTVNEYAGIDDAVAGIVTDVPDLVLLDIDLGDHYPKGGFSVAMAVNRSHPQVPFIFLSGQSDSETMKTGMAIGALDFVDKDYQLDKDPLLDIFLARINGWLEVSQARRMQYAGNNHAEYWESTAIPGTGKCESKLLKASHLRIDTVTKNVEWKGKPVPLTLTPTNILIYLVSNGDRMISCDELSKANNGVSEETVRSNIFFIREAFRNADAKFRDADCIINERNKGYRWVG